MSFSGDTSISTGFNEDISAPVKRRPFCHRVLPVLRRRLEHVWTGPIEGGGEKREDSAVIFVELLEMEPSIREH
jgi:hypothetical protein